MKTNLFGKLSGLLFKQKTQEETDTQFLYNHRLQRQSEQPERHNSALQIPLKLFSLVLVLGMIGLPFAKVLAATFLTLDSFSGPAVTIHATSGGWQGGEQVLFYLSAPTGTPVATANADGGGNVASIPIPIPANTPQGPLAIYAHGGLTNATESNSYYVVPFTPTITVASSPNTPGSSVAISGSGFAPSEVVKFAINGTVGGQATADSSGAFAGALFTIPSLTAATYQLHAIGQSSGADAIYYFFIGGFYPAASPSTYYLLPGDTLSFSGSGFGPAESIQVTQGTNATVLSTITAASDGSFTTAGTFTIPVALAGGVRTFHLHGSLGNNAPDVMVTVGTFNGQISPSAYFVSPGDVLNFSGNGFAKTETVQVFVASTVTPVASFTSDSSGGFTNQGNISIPFSYAGTTKTFTVKGLTSNTTASVDITVGGLFPAITPSVYFVLPGQTFSINGSGFAANETVNVVMGSNSVVATADKTGSFAGAGPFTAPFTGTSLHIVATGALSGVSASTDVTLGTLFPSVSPSSWWVMPGTPISFTGSGFAPGETVTISSGTTNVGSAIADSSGNFTSATSTIAFGSSGNKTYKFVGANSGATASVSITVAGLSPYADADTYYITPGSTVHVGGHSFASGEGVTITLGSNTVHATADFSGNIAPTAITIPFGSSNPAIVTLTGDLSGAVATVPITLAPFYPGVTPDTWYTAPGTTVHFSGNGFASGETVSATLNTASVGSTTASASGTIANFAITIPIAATTAHFVFTGATSGASATVDIGLSGFNPQITPSTWYTPAGSSVSFTGSGFAPGETVTATFNSSTTPITTDGSGNFTSPSFTIPFNATTAHFSFTSSQSHNTQTFDIGVAALSPGIVLSTYWDQGGKPLTVTGMGFAGNETVTVSFDGATLGTPTADNSGNFSLVTTVPFGPAGNVSVQARGNTSGAMTAVSTFTRPQIFVNLQLGAYAGAPGDAVTFIGSGYLPNEPIQVTTDRTGSTIQYSFTADASGNFNNSGWTIPSAFTGGPLKLTITGTHSFTTTNINYYVTGP